MGSVTKSERDGVPEFRDPNFAATLSLMPGLGQIYIGQRRKGTLFLAVGIINLVIFAVLLFQQSILFSLNECATIYHLKANQSLSECLSMLRIGTPPANILLTLIFGFIALAMRDARNSATQVKYSGLYPTSLIGLEEAASGSYVLHVLMIIAAFVLAFFFVAAPPPSKQFTVIEMVDTELTTTKKRQETRFKSTHSTQAHGPKSREAPAQTSQTSATSPSSKTSPNTNPVLTRETKVAPEKAGVKPMAAPPAMAHPPLAPVKQTVPQPVLPKVVKAMAQPLPLPLRTASKATTAPTPTTTPKTKSSTAAPTPLPKVNLAQLPAAALGPMPKKFEPNSFATPNPVGSTAARKNAHDDFAPHGPEASAISAPPAESGSAGNTPAPIGEYQRTGKGKTASNPIPTKASFSGGPAPSQPITFGPAVLGNGKGQEAKKGASPTDETKGPTEPGTDEATDWGPYMADLQRRIKTHWFPVRNLESVKVVVVFKVSKNGELSNLRLARSSGYAEADKRAMAAVEDAAPFRSLPQGSDPIVDIQFTFDYNVFKGGGRGY
jgi:TonB family protein